QVPINRASPEDFGSCARIAMQQTEMLIINDSHVRLTMDHSFVACASISLRVLRKTLPTALFGRAGLNSINDGSLYFASRSRQCSDNSSAEAFAPSLSTTKALTASPRYLSGTPITQASRIAG